MVGVKIDTGLPLSLINDLETVIVYEHIGRTAL